MTESTQTSQTNFPRWTGKRPCKQDWPSKKTEIEQRIAEGYGLIRLSKAFSLSPRGMQLVLSRLGLQTIYQKAYAEAKAEAQQ